VVAVEPLSLSRRARDAWGPWVQSLAQAAPGHVFITSTSATRTHPESMGKFWRKVWREENCRLWGRTWEKQGEGLCMILAHERHQSGLPHAHLMVWHPVYDVLDREVLEHRRLSRYCTNLMGWTRVEAIRVLGDVAGYVSKYVTKAGDIEFLGPIGGPQGRLCESSRAVASAH
jgi:hypothetical protein